MARIESWDAPKNDLPAPGVYRVEVKSAEEKLSGAGNPMFVLELIDLDRRKTLCTDRIMLTGKGWKFGRERLIALGVPMTEKEVLASSLVGRRCFVAIEHKDETFNDKATGEPRTIAKTNIDITATEPWGGYWPENAPPPSYRPIASAEDEFPVGPTVPF